MRYEKGRKDTSRRRIMDVAVERFRTDGIAGSGLATIMKDAGLTNGAFYPHFPSKADLVRETISDALSRQAVWLRDVLDQGGLDRLIDIYLSHEHRDNAGQGCASAALLPELARQSEETRAMYAEQSRTLVLLLANALPADVEAKEDVACAIFATLIGTLQLARAVDKEMSDRILLAGKDAIGVLAGRPRAGASSA
ncbi:TetR family transcriptional regulator protein (plasmid) [Rhizobium gallicum bv. gallicum R602sp]|uniref:TetR family transcriptional regulator protein n=1 Tax=Rhizobium gallicum bv. gallicum R602sp TaxID=1041138 RepID=A0A0B4XD04_9HYPH|nr:TetR/AcrR family transcriptional regulator [Rhizobium gallicum]AJD44412.1 TetR family transcriptional regulator protein [Rhizobium gallicum bv. gallicum R602sp]TDW20282.1 TetR family transcriptional regulator [Rhizobium azibense]